MNKPHSILTRTGGGGWLLGLLLLSGGTTLLGATNPTAANRTAPAAAVVPAVKSIPKSLFLYEYKAGSKDPFFPDSIRRQPVSGETGRIRLPPGPVTELPALRGILFSSKKQPLALINDLILRPGGEGRTTLSGREVAIRCLEIQRQMVVITVDNIRRELPLPPDLGSLLKSL